MPALLRPPVVRTWAEAVAEAFALRVMRPLADKVRPEAEAVAAEVIVKETPLTTEAMVAPTGMPEPVID